MPLQSGRSSLMTVGEGRTEDVVKASRITLLLIRFWLTQNAPAIGEGGYDLFTWLHLPKALSSKTSLRNPGHHCRV